MFVIFNILKPDVGAVMLLAAALGSVVGESDLLSFGKKRQCFDPVKIGY